MMRFVYACHPRLQRSQILQIQWGRRLRRHLQGFKNECELKINVDSKLQAKFFPHSLEGEAREWFYALPEGSITSFGELSSLFLEQYKHNIKQEVMVSDMCAIK